MSVGKRKDGRWYTDITIRRDGRDLRSRDACGPEVRNRAQAMALEHQRRAEMIAGKTAVVTKADGTKVAAGAHTFRVHAEEVLVLHAAVENKHSERKSK